MLNLSSSGKGRIHSFIQIVMEDINHAPFILGVGELFNKIL